MAILVELVEQRETSQNHEKITFSTKEILENSTFP